MDHIYQNEEKENHEVIAWKAIWYAPSAAIRTVIERQSFIYVMMLAILVGVTNILGKAFGGNLVIGLKLPMVLLVTILVGAVAGLTGWLLLSAIMTLTGKIFAGKATFKEMMMAIGAAYIPAASTILLYILDLVFYGNHFFTDAEISTMQIIWSLFSMLLSIILSFWTIFLIIKAVSEAHRFAAWKGLLTFIIPVIAMLFLLFVLLVISLFIFV